MVQGSPQFTPRQLLEAGRRAEAEGKLGDAKQLYRHLADHFANTAEALEARNGLGRVGGASQQVWPGEGGEASWPTALDRNGASARRPQRHRYVPQERNYAVGRALAHLIGILGWLVASAGLVAIVLPLAADATAWTNIMPASLTQMMAAATPLRCASLAAAGIALIFLSQLAIALFDQADATRELLAVERAKLEEDR